MLSIAIVEDDKMYSDLLEGFIKRYAEENDLHFKVKTFSDGLAILADYDQGFNIIFMDIELPRLDGMKASRKIRQIDDKATIIFVTNMAKYAVQGYEVDALDFIVKPVEYFNFAIKFAKAIKIQNRLYEDTVMIPSDDGVVKHYARDIYYIESDRHYMIYHTESGDIRVRGSMKDIEKQLAKMNFTRCNNSFLVNLAAVDRVAGDTVFVAGHELSISRSKKKEFLDSLTVFYGFGGGTR